MSIGNEGAELARLIAIESDLVTLQSDLTIVKHEVIEVEKHFHNNEKWFGLAATPVGETHRADRMDGLIQPFQLVAGASAFGDWVQIFGSDDSPVVPGMTRGDSHRAMITGTDSTNPFIVQLIAGESADIIANLAIDEFTEFPYIAATNAIESGITEVMSKRFTEGVKLWARCACVGATGKLIDFYVGLHEYLE